MTAYLPIIVNKDYCIIDGQHRFMACRMLNLPIYYVRMDEQIENDIALKLLNMVVRQWRMEDSVKYNAEMIGEEYADMITFFDTYPSLGMSNIIVIYPQKAINSTQIRGCFRFTKAENADAIAQFLLSSEISILPFSNTRPFVLAVKHAFDKYSKKQLLKLKNYILRVRQCANYEQYENVFENIIKGKCK